MALTYYPVTTSALTAANCVLTTVSLALMGNYFSVIITVILLKLGKNSGTSLDGANHSGFLSCRVDILVEFEVIAL